MKKILLAAALLCLMAWEVGAARPAARNCRIVFIGNSITFGALHEDKSRTAPPVYASHRLARMLGSEVEFRNCGRSGATTLDFHPAKERDFRRVEKAVEELKGGEGPMIFSIMLGTNDSASKGPTGSPVSNDDYEANLLAMISRLRELAPGALFILHKPIWYSPNTYNGAVYLVDGQKRLEGYFPVIDKIVSENSDIYAGDSASYDFFRKHHMKYCFAENGHAGIFYLHPTEKGARKLARNWARAIAHVVREAR